MTKLIRKMIRDVPLMTLIQPIVMHHHLGFGPSWMTTFCDDLLEDHNQTVTYKGISCSAYGHRKGAQKRGQGQPWQHERAWRSQASAANK